jgi:hypothetical protein
VGARAAATGNELAKGRGYALVDRHGKRVGTFIEPVAGNQIAIRHEGAFLWRRRVLPASTVAAIVPEERAIVLGLDRRDVAGRDLLRALQSAGRTDPEEGSDWNGDWPRLLQHYAGSNEDEPREQWASQADGKGTSEMPAPSATERLPDEHLLFISTPHGYRLVERPGPPPAALEDVAVPEHGGSFRVTKQAPSPLPNDRRVCAYLEVIA